MRLNLKSCLAGGVAALALGSVAFGQSNPTAPLGRSFPSSPDAQAIISAAQAATFAAPDGTPNFGINPTNGSVNYIKATGNVAGSSPSLQATGSDANVSFGLVAKGTGSTTFSNGDGRQFNVGDPGGLVNSNYLSAQAGTGSSGLAQDANLTASSGDIAIIAPGASYNQNVFLGTNGANGFQPALEASVYGAESPVTMYWQFTGGNTSARITTQGSATNIPAVIGSKGNQSLTLANTGGTIASFISNCGTCASYGNNDSLNIVDGQVGSNSVSVYATGVDTNPNLFLYGSGAGVAYLGSAACTASGASPQTCNSQRGSVTTAALTTAAATDASYTINDTSVLASSIILCADEGYSGTIVTNGIPLITSCTAGAGTITVHVTNVGTNAMNGTVKIGFLVQ